jgi:hypothetical protein
MPSRNTTHHFTPLFHLPLCLVRVRRQDHRGRQRQLDVLDNGALQQRGLLGVARGGAAAVAVAVSRAGWEHGECD